MALLVKDSLAHFYFSFSNHYICQVKNHGSFHSSIVLDWKIVKDSHRQYCHLDYSDASHFCKARGAVV
jgi:hypothetical protein